MVLLNYFTKGFFMYLVYVNFTTVFLPNTLLLFSYLLYAFLEFAAFGASIALILASRIIRIILRVNVIVYFFNHSSIQLIALYVYQYFIQYSNFV